MQLSRQLFTRIDGSGLRAQDSSPSLSSRAGASLSITLLLPLLLSLYWAATANGPLFTAALADRRADDPGTWTFIATLAVALVALHVAVLSLLALLTGRRAFKPVVAVLLVCAALAAHYMGQFGVYLDATMLRNVLHTQPGEARELLSASLLWHLLLYAGLPLLVLWRWPAPPRRWQTRMGAAVTGLVVGLVVLVLAVLAMFQPFAALMRNHKEVRYLITPSNLLYSSARVLAADTRSAVVARREIGLDAAPGPRMLARQKPTLLVVVVGETARAANWGLNGYERQTTPKLATLPVVNFREVTSCGTNTETSVPCMFAPIGRRDYDEARIRGEQSLLHVLARAGVQVHWRDNQTGCKGVCEGLPNDTVREVNPATWCQGDHCLDEGLLDGLEQRLATASGTQVLVLHQLGNHGPAYHRRYPPEFARFQPACTEDDLSRCSREGIVNAYDNALLYTDHLLATLVERLRAGADRVDSAMIYVSDHGESLGENRLYLHGVPTPWRRRCRPGCRW
jgi:lipid A ethanolaminephosphotransferase